MPNNYRRRFSEQEMRTELVEHFRRMPEERVDADLVDAAARKAANYAEALRHLDEALDRVNAAAAGSTDPVVKAAAEFSARKISAAIDAYGEASLVKNHSWGDGTGT